jgi:hypothetical protein
VAEETGNINVVLVDLQARLTKRIGHRHLTGLSRLPCCSGGSSSTTTAPSA